VSESKHVKARLSFGALAIFSGLGLLLLIVFDSTYGLPWAMPRTWYIHRTIWGGLGLVACAAGWLLQRRPAPDESHWNPAAGRRFRKLVVYSRNDCHLCDDAKAVLALYLDYLPEIESVDIDADADLKKRHDAEVPVVEIDGQLRFRGRVDEILLRRLIESTPPIA
jgi:glutaredoxin